MCVYEAATWPNLEGLLGINVHSVESCLLVFVISICVSDVMIVLLDLSAAFDTADLGIFSQRLVRVGGIRAGLPQITPIR